MKSNTTFFFCVILSVSLWCISLSCAQIQETQKYKSATPHSQARLAVLAIGPKPLRRYTAEDKDQAHAASTLLLPRPYEIPPKILFNLATNKSGNLLPINVSFNNPPSFISAPASKTFRLKQSLTDESDPYIILSPLKPGSVNLILLQPSSTAPKRWQSDPKMHKLVLSAPNIIRKDLAFINLSRRPIKTQFHQAEKIILPGTSQLYSKISGQLLHRISAHYGHENKLIINTAIKLPQSDTSSHNLYIFYDANPNTNAGKTIGLMRVSVDTTAEQTKLFEKKPYRSAKKDQRSQRRKP